MPNEEQPKIIVDSDWKEQARKEKEQLEQLERERSEQHEIPEPSILEVVQMVVMQASVGLGGFQDPRTGQRVAPDLLVAKHYIDLLELVQKKTKNNLTEEEATVIEGLLHELRMAFVQIAGVGKQGGQPGPAVQS